ncbi:MAG: HDOD domain-containing protein [Planctomycetota bacterium]|nr:MAG: HDOD domain-containing protein [Planctomycetota bacterium]
MRVSAVGEAATQLPWLSPCAASLLALARMPAAAAWERLRHDPGAVLLVVRRVARSLSTTAISFFPALLREPAILEGALRFLTSELPESRAAVDEAIGQTTDSGPGTVAGFVDWYQPAMRPIYHACLLYARLAQRVAEMTGSSDPDNAWVAGLLAPLGWLAVCAANPQSVTACQEDAALAQDSVGTQQRYWGLDQAAIARRLLRSWQVPRWLALVVGHLGLPGEVAQSLGADPDLFHVVQMAVGLAQQHGQGLYLAVGDPPGACAAALRLTARDQERLAHEVAGPLEFPEAPQSWERPGSVPLLRDLLLLAAENHRLREAPSLEQLERDRDELHHALERLRTGEAERLQRLKLQGLAEFAAGAAHEINNPLAVISGQAQYLLGHEGDAGRQKSLQTIIAQAQRIHQVLSEVMQYARPPRPQRQMVDVRSLLREVTLALSDLAVERQVQLISPEADHPIQLSADPRQISTALECLLRNAIEAAPAGGWASLRLEMPAPERLDLIVEDSGTGPAPAQIQHMFDPFYSGRQAGRGRGLGLPTAWRLAREHGGEVRFDNLSGGPTRFVLSLPRSADNHAAGMNGLTLVTPERMTG